MSEKIKMRQSILKTILWAIMGVLAVVTILRFMPGIGAALALTDATPWGFWIAFCVMSGLAIASGGFVIAATSYIFDRGKYHVFARPAILTAFLGYSAVAVGLLYDSGLPWNKWHPMIHPQYHSMLFEVAMCVMLCLTVLLLEFPPVVLEHRRFDRPLFGKSHKILKKAAIVLVITGIVLSTLHQFSIGSLFLITPFQPHPLWYSPIIWILFFASAVALGLMMVSTESFFSAWFFGHKLRQDRLAGLGKAASVVLFIYVGLRVGDLALRGAIGSVLDGSWQSFLFLSELLIGALIPAILLLFKPVRNSKAGLASCAGLTVLGMIGYRFNVCIVAFARPEGMSYFPSWMEIVVSLGIVAGAMLVFIYFVEKFKVYPEEDDERVDDEPPVQNKITYSPISTRIFLPDSLNAPRRYSLAAITAAAITIALFPADVLVGSQSVDTPVVATRTLNGWMQKHPTEPGHVISINKQGDLQDAEARQVSLLMIDGNRDGQLVLFPHDYHISELDDKDSCGICHHQNMPFDINTSCYECHRDMYSTTDIFNHSSHIKKIGGNQSCIHCHRDSNKIKSRDTVTPCIECHTDMVVKDSIIPRLGEMKGFSSGYMDAMHGLCITCHEMEEKPARYGSRSAECVYCHRDVDGSQLHQMKPYDLSRAGKK